MANSASNIVKVVLGLSCQALPRLAQTGHSSSEAFAITHSLNIFADTSVDREVARIP